MTLDSIITNFKMLMKVFLLVLVPMQDVVARESSWSMIFTQTNASIFKVQANYMYEDSYVTVSVLCDSKGTTDAQLELTWILQQIDCVQELYEANINSTGLLFDAISRYFNNVTNVSTEWTTERNSSQIIASTYFQMVSVDFNCGSNSLILLHDESSSPYFEAQFYKNGFKPQIRRIDRQPNKTASERLRVASIWSDGMYHFLIRIHSPFSQSFSASVTVQMRGSQGLLSAIEWPLLTVAGCMSLLYLSAGTIWIFVWAKSQEHTQKIHMIIGAVAVAGALGNTLAFTDMSVRNSDGIGIYGVYWVGEFVSVCQISLTLLLIMIVSTGHGINRPVLSSIHLQVMVALTAFSFVSHLSLLITSDETLKIKYRFPSIFTIVSVIYLVIMLVVTGWIMVFSINTFVYLFQRRHSSESKLKVFCLFMSCCISVFISHFVIGAILLSDRGWFKDCRQNWKQEWIASSFSQLLVFVQLTVLMWLWRPMDELMSYGFEPLSTTEPPLEEDSADEKERIMMEEI